MTRIGEGMGQEALRGGRDAKATHSKVKVAERGEARRAGGAAVQDALLDVARFWLDRGVDGFRFDAINFAMHDPQLRDNPPAPPGGRRASPDRRARRPLRRRRRVLCDESASDVSS